MRLRSSGDDKTIPDVRDAAVASCGDPVRGGWHAAGAGGTGCSRPTHPEDGGSGAGGRQQDVILLLDDSAIQAEVSTRRDGLDGARDAHQRHPPAAEPRAAQVAGLPQVTSAPSPRERTGDTIGMGVQSVAVQGNYLCGGNR